MRTTARGASRHEDWPDAMIRYFKRRREELARHHLGEPLEAWQQRRAWLVLGVLVGLFTLVAARLMFLHLLPARTLSREEITHVGTRSLRQERGSIRDRNNTVLAVNETRPSIWVEPARIKPEDFEKVVASIRAHIDIGEEELRERMTRRGTPDRPVRSVPIRRWIAGLNAEAVKAMTHFQGVFAEYEPLRYYPHDDLAAHVIGFVNQDEEVSEGIEAQFNHLLAGKAGQEVGRKDARQRMLPSFTLEYVPPEGGYDVVLTIDAKIQQRLEDALDARMQERGAPTGMGVIMDPRSGAIVAMASRPAFNPNDFRTTDPALLKNRVLLDRFEPGSVFKIIVSAAALEYALVTPDTMIDCRWGKLQIGRHTIHDVHGMGREPFTVCFAKSSNIAMIDLANRLGKERMDAWIRRFGFAQRTCPDVKYESAGLYTPLKEWHGLSLATQAMGQGISVTMLQLARAYAVIANGGLLVEPYLVEKAVDKDGAVVYQRRGTAPVRILSEATAATMRELCHSVVSDGTGRHAAIDEYRVGGKTGTAQVARLKKDGGGYDPNRSTSLFAGFAPLSDPRLVAVIVIQDSKVFPRYGGVVCGPVFKDVMRYALTVMQVPPEPEDDYIDRSPPGVNESDAEERVAQLNAEELARIESDPALMLASVSGTQPVSLPEDGYTGGPVLPNLLGMTKIEAMNALQSLGIASDFRGAGWVVQQDPPPGSPLDEVSLCQLHFSNERPAPPEPPQSSKSKAKSNGKTAKRAR